ncbi:MAG: DUF2336 domain-containing protein [Alphaproteobacteria bacterium]|nr:MAG: DUF2336 domain-containing protein [Alphaproteobacteria bacterium]
MTDTPQTQQLSKADVARLLSNPSPEVRAETSAKVAGQFAAGGLSEAERKIAEDIFRALVKDVEIRVREALSVHLKHSPDVPHDVAVTLARDVDSVALPMLKFSEVLTDEDLIEIVRGDSSAKQVAIAQRPKVSAPLADALIDTGNERAVARLVSNEGADLTEKALGRVMSEYENSEAVSDSLSRRPNIPAAISTRLVDLLTQRLHDYLTAKHELPPDVASTLILQARERATMSLIEHGSSDAELEKLIDQLYKRRRLTPSLLLRALCLGDMNFFERAMARLAGVELQNARVLIHDQGVLGLQSIYLKANLPQRLFPAFRAGVDVAAETDYDGGPNDRERYIERMLERVLTQGEDPNGRMSQEDVEFLLHKLEQIAA